LKRLPAGQPRDNIFLYSLGRPRQRWEEGIRMDLIVREIGWRGGGRVDAVGSGQGPVAGCCKCGDESAGSGVADLVKSVMVRGNIALPCTRA
jgi:hypothetical protein